MKTTKLLLLSLLTLFFTNVHATILIVDNGPLSGAPYKDIQPAINAAQPGDTIYVQGSTTEYSGSYTANFKLTIIGSGYNPSGTQYNLKTY